MNLYVIVIAAIVLILLCVSLARLGKGKGGYWEDLGYEWYAGI